MCAKEFGGFPLAPPHHQPADDAFGKTIYSSSTTFDGWAVASASATPTTAGDTITDNAIRRASKLRFVKSGDSGRQGDANKADIITTLTNFRMLLLLIGLNITKSENIEENPIYRVSRITSPAGKSFSILTHPRPGLALLRIEDHYHRLPSLICVCGELAAVAQTY